MATTGLSQTQEEHASFIKNVHAQLRGRVQKSSASELPEDIWKEHVQNSDMLKKYAESMRKLATDVWQIKHKETPENSRIKWIHEAILSYYTKPQLERARAYDDRLGERHGVTPHTWSSAAQLSAREMFETLDVGSCYGPLKAAERLRVTSFDLQPADDSVLQGDLLHLPITSETTWAGSRLLSLAAGSYHAVVFSLVLEYLPTPQLRYSMCRRAAQLLQPEGVLVVVSPDSSHRTANGRLYRGWKMALQTLGLVRVRYEKLEHLHCMVFRKSVHPELAITEARGHIEDAAVNRKLIWRDTAIWWQNTEPEVPVQVNRGDEAVMKERELLTVSDGTVENHEAIAANRCVSSGTVSDDHEHQQIQTTGGSVDNRSKVVIPRADQLMVIHQDFKPVVLEADKVNSSGTCAIDLDVSDMLEALPQL